MFFWNYSSSIIIFGCDVPNYHFIEKKKKKLAYYDNIV